MTQKSKMETVKIIKEISTLCDSYRMRRIKKTHKSEIEIEEEIKLIRDKCKDCWLRKHCIISQTVEKIRDHSETGYDVLEAAISFWNDCCPYIDEEDDYRRKGMN